MNHPPARIANYNGTMADLGKLLVFLGALLALIGAALWGLGRLGLRGLPGDIRFQTGNVRFYFPIITSIVLSVLLTLLLWLWHWLGRR